MDHVLWRLDRYAMLISITSSCLVNAVQWHFIKNKIDFVDVKFNYFDLFLCSNDGLDDGRFWTWWWPQPRSHWFKNIDVASFWSKNTMLCIQCLKSDLYYAARTCMIDTISERIFLCCDQPGRNFWNFWYAFYKLRALIILHLKGKLKPS